MKNTTVTITVSEEDQKILDQHWEEVGIGNDILPELKNFLNLINGDKPADEFCKEVEKEVWKTKQDAETRRNFMDFEYMKMLAQIDAKKEERISIFASLVRDGVLSLSEAMKRSDLSEDEIKQWIQKNPAK